MVQQQQQQDSVKRGVRRKGRAPGMRCGRVRRLRQLRRGLSSSSSRDTSLASTEADASVVPHQLVFKSSNGEVDLRPALFFLLQQSQQPAVTSYGPPWLDGSDADSGDGRVALASSSFRPLIQRIVKTGGYLTSGTTA